MENDDSKIPDSSPEEEKKRKKREYMKLRYAANPELERQRGKDSYRRNKAKNDTPENRAKKNEAAKKSREKNRDEINRRKREKRLSDPAAREAERLQSMAYYHAHKDQCRANTQKWRKKNRADDLARMRAWMKSHRAEMNLYKARRAALKKSLIHPGNLKWVELSFYKLARSITKKTGILHAVDHIIPLEAKGPVHHLNLQVMPQSVNGSKNDNPFWQKPGFLSWRDVPRFLWPAELAPQYEAILAQEAVKSA